MSHIASSGPLELTAQELLVQFVLNQICYQLEYVSPLFISLTFGLPTGSKMQPGLVFSPTVLGGTLTPWSKVLLEKLTGLQLVKKFPAFHGTRRFITALTSVRHLSLSWASPIQSIYPHPTCWRSILILSIHLRLGLPSGLILRMRNISDKVCGWIKTHISCSTKNVFENHLSLCDHVEIFCTAGQATDDNMTHAHCVLDH